MLARLLKLALVGGLVVALAGDPARPAAATPSRVTVRDGLACREYQYGRELTRVCAAVHTSTDRLGNATARAAGAVATYTTRGRPLATKKALRVRLVGDPVLTRARPYISHRRARRGPARIVMVAQAQVRAIVRHGDGRWTRHLVSSRVVRMA